MSCGAGKPLLYLKLLIHQWKQRMRIQKFVLCQPHVCVVQKHVQTCSVWKLPQDFRTSSGFKRCNPVIIPSVYGLIRLPKKALARQCCESNACKPSIGWPLGTVLLAEFTLENSVALGVADVTGEQPWTVCPCLVTQCHCDGCGCRCLAFWNPKRWFPHVSSSERGAPTW